MSHIISLVKRDIKVFYRTKTNVFFSLLGVLILVVLHFVIFRSMYADNWVNALAQNPLIPPMDIRYSRWVSDSLMFAAIIPIGSLTITLTTLGLIVSDKDKNVLSDFLVSPVNRNRLFLSYLISSFLIGFVMLLGFVAFFQIYFSIVYGFGFTLLQFVIILGCLIGSLVFGNIFMLLLLSFIRSEHLGSVGAIVGTFSGFVGGAYIPLAMFGDTVGSVFSALPFAQITVLVRGAFLMELENITPLTHEIISGEIARGFGIELWLWDFHVPPGLAVLMTAGFTLIFLVCLIFRFRKMKKAD